MDVNIFSSSDLRISLIVCRSIPQKKLLPQGYHLNSVRELVDIGQLEW